ncbi:hypothetical protein PSTT_07672 [Puccinia striiformis]|uniref:Uncharacterized protein n=1 Tax=Puccinia striiformis TaxID=27350 RepID=A0A2S4VFI5_9BASI|nr:hypothetical protein PSTT_07672 [Puccinia striiformis]
MVEEAPPCQPPRNEETEQTSPKTEGLSLMKKFKAKIRTVTNDHAHGFSNPLKDNPTSPGKQHSDGTINN